MELVRTASPLQEHSDCDEETSLDRVEGLTPLTSNRRGNYQLISFAISSRLGRKRGLVGVVLVAGASLALVARNALTACVPVLHTGGASVISLIEQSAEDLISLPPANDDAIANFLASGEAAKEAAESVDMQTEAKLAVERAFASGDKTKTESAVKTAMERGAVRWREQRLQLKQHLANNASGNTSFLGSRSHFSKRGMDEDEKGKVDQAEKASVASCVFDVLQATSQLAALAANIHDAVKTCRNISGYEVDTNVNCNGFDSDPNLDCAGNNSTDRLLCAINIESIFYSAAAIAGALSVAANNCACTIKGNLDALCAGSISTMIQSVTQVAITAELIAASCGRGDGLDCDAPSNIGNHTPCSWQSQSQDEWTPIEGTSEVQGRRLLLGGGNSSDATFCAVDISSALWYLAEAGLAINAAANPDGCGACTVAEKVGEAGASPKDGRRSKAFCAADVAGAIYGFLQAIYFIFFSTVHCPDHFDIHALCGTGISGLMASLAGIAYSGSSMWLTCKDLQNHWPWPTARSPLAVKMMEDNVLGNSGHGGRRLTGDGVASQAGKRGGSKTTKHVGMLKERFSSPVEAFKSIGYDITDESADFRKVGAKKPLSKSIIELMQEQASDADNGAGTTGLFGEQQQCA